MHEHGIADRLVEEALVMARNQGLARIEEIGIEVGALSGLSREALDEPMRHALTEAGMADVKVRWREVPPEAACRRCGRSIGRAHACPSCGGFDVEVVAGTAVSVVAVS